MSENRDEATGQSTDEPLTGRAGLEHDAGYVPMPAEAVAPEELTVKEAAEEKADHRGTSEANIVTHIAGVDMPKNMTMTLEQGAEALSDVRAADREQADIDQVDQIRAEVDKLRGDGSEQAAETRAGPTDDEPDLDKVLNHPKIQKALSSRIAEAQVAKETYSKAVDLANQFARAAFIENFPDIAALPLPHWEGALIAMAAREPARFQKAIGTLRRVVTLQHEEKLQEQRRRQQQQSEFRQYARAEDARFADMVKGEAPARMQAIEAEIPRMLSDLGVDPLAFLRAGHESKFLRSAAAQKILVDAAKYRMLMSAPKAVATRAVPRVQRPGASSPRLSSSEAKLSDLSRQFAAATGNKQLRIAAQIQALRRAART
jgi:hypothetical protein